MKKAVGLMLAGSLFGLVCLARGEVPADPVYQGKSLSEWLRGYDHDGRGSKLWDAADDAVRHVGTKAIPLLLEKLRQPDGTGNREASMAFIVLGAEARSAVPSLIKIYQENHSGDSRRAVEDVFSWIGPEAIEAIPLLLQAATNADMGIRANAAWALGEIHCEAKICVPALIQALKDSDGWTRLSAAHALGKFGIEAQTAVPALTKLLDDPDPMVSMRIQVRSEAKGALEKIQAAERDLY